LVWHLEDELGIYTSAVNSSQMEIMDAKFAATGKQKKAGAPGLFYASM